MSRYFHILFSVIICSNFNNIYSLSSIISNRNLRKDIEILLELIEKFDKFQPYFLKSENDYIVLQNKISKCLEDNKKLKKEYDQACDSTEKKQKEIEIELANEKLTLLQQEIGEFIDKCQKYNNKIY